LRLAALAYSAGIRSLVASSHEIAELRAHYPDSKLVIPGIRPAGALIGDQKRVATPASAIAAGADYLVIGRPITQAPDPAAAAQAILDEIAAVTA
jgi:orotidine-5'-phosphate decarboxylase